MILGAVCERSRRSVWKFKKKIAAGSSFHFRLDQHFMVDQNEFSIL